MDIMKNKGRQIYVIADTHFGHQKMVDWSLRPDFYNSTYHQEVTSEVIGYAPAKLGRLV